MFDCNTENGQPRHNPITGDEGREMVSELMNVPVDMIAGYVVLTIHKCDRGCDPPHLILCTSDLSTQGRGYVAQRYLGGLQEAWLQSGGEW